ncbi:MAG: hypothetical protein QW175_03205 [Candidatus Bathyarchaeia archaeon]
MRDLWNRGVRAVLVFVTNDLLKMDGGSDLPNFPRSELATVMWCTRCGISYQVRKRGHDWSA